MKGTGIALILLLSAAASSWGETVYLEPYGPPLPGLLGRGGAGTSLARGYSALWTNPAGLARPAQETLTLFDFQGTVNLPPSQVGSLINLYRSGSLDNFDLLDPDSRDALVLIQSLLASNGAGASASLTPFGLVINGLGLALNMSAAAYARGDSLTGTTAVTEAAVGGVIGFAMPVKLGASTWYFGMDVRPMFRGISFTSVVDLLQSFSGSGGDLTTTATAGLSPAFAIDVGVLGEVGEWSFGASLRDSSTPLDFKFHTWEKLLKEPGSLGGGKPSRDTHVVPLTLSAGVGWEPKPEGFWSAVLPKIALDLTIPFQGEQTPSWGTWLHLGGELNILNYLILKAGINQGYITGGLGIRLGVLDTGFSVYSEEMGLYAGEKRRTTMGLTGRIVL